MVLALVVAACGPSPSTSAPSGTGAAPTAAPLTKLRIGSPGNFLPLASPYIAKSKGYFEEEGLDVEIFNAPSLQCMTGLISGQFPVGACGSTDIMVATEKGERVLTIANVYPTVGLHFYVRNDVLARLKVTGTSPLRERLAAMKGLRISVSGVGSAAHQALNMMVREAGLQESDVTIAPINMQAAQFAALLEKQIDGIVGGPPLSDQVEIGGVATILVRGGDIPILADVIYQAVSTTPKWAEENPELARKVVRAIAKANEYLRTSPDAPAHMNATDWKTISTEILSISLNRHRQNFAPKACFTAAQAKGLVTYALAVGVLTKSVDSADGSFWTNKYNSGCP